MTRRKITQLVKNEIVNLNIEEAKLILQDIKRANLKGSVHTVNAIRYKMEHLLSKEIKYDTEEFQNLCKYKMTLAHILYFELRDKQFKVGKL